MPNTAFGFLIQVLQDKDGVLSMRIRCTMLGETYGKEMRQKEESFFICLD